MLVAQCERQIQVSRSRHDSGLGALSAASGPLIRTLILISNSSPRQPYPTEAVNCCLGASGDTSSLRAFILPSVTSFLPARLSLLPIVATS